MRTTAVLASALILTNGFGLVSTASAQENADFTDAQRELEVAREQLSAAAQEVARLSIQANAPAVGRVIREFNITGRRAMLGINIEDSVDGVVVAGVSPGGPADESGVETGDVIIAIDAAALSGSDVSSPSEVLIGQMAHVNPGDVVVLNIVRGDEEHDIEVEARVLEAQYFAGAFAGPAVPFPQGDFRAGGQPPIAFDFTRRIGRWADMELVELTPALGAYFGTDEGVLVVSAPSDDALQLQDGDVILEIGSRTPTSPEHAMRILGSFEPGETLELTIMRNQRRQTLELELVDRRSG
ncbi:MAG: PDZ domain-containing protein [Gammaproteobacteria bacterium]|nr:PDZ domain-containing protein [Gammaproteobacteria bacterium]